MDELGLCIDRVKKFDPKGLSYNSKFVREGWVFFALKGSRVDGSDFVEELLKKFSRILVVSQREFRDNRCIKVENIKECMGRVASWFFGYPSNKLSVIGITGTNGKTTTTYLLESIFPNSGLIGTTGYTKGDKRVKLMNTTPESLDMHRIFKEMLEEGVSYCFAEISSHAISFNRIAGVGFKCKVFTNISQDHLDFYRTMDNYASTKISFFSDSDSKVVNIDDRYGRFISKNAITYGFSEDAFIRPVEYYYSLEGIRMRLSVGGRYLEIESPLVGEYNIYNIMAAVGVAYFFGIDFSDIEKGIAESKGAPGRLEFFTRDGVYAVVDYAHTDNAMENVLTTLGKIKKNRIITVFGAGGDRDKIKRPKMGRVAEILSDVVVVTSDNPRTENPLSIIDDILSGISSRKNVIVEPDRFKAIEMALGMATKGDVVAILGKGHEDYQILGDRVVHFDDREVVKKIWKLD